MEKREGLELNPWGTPLLIEQQAELSWTLCGNGWTLEAMHSEVIVYDFTPGFSTTLRGRCYRRLTWCQRRRVWGEKDWDPLRLVPLCIVCRWTFCTQIFQPHLRIQIGAYPIFYFGIILIQEVIVVIELKNIACDYYRSILIELGFKRVDFVQWDNARVVMDSAACIIPILLFTDILQ